MRHIIQGKSHAAAGPRDQAGEDRTTAVAVGRALGRTSVISTPGAADRSPSNRKMILIVNGNKHSGSPHLPGLAPSDSTV